jgi:GTP 3',8-cyclase
MTTGFCEDDNVEERSETSPVDLLGRPLRDLRLSVTDRCNLRCNYCMPEKNYIWLPRGDILTFNEMRRLVEVFVSLGVSKVRITGGEPLLRRTCLSSFVSSRPTDRVRDLAMTTNGVLLAPQAHALREAGLRRVTVSLDTLRADRFESLSQRTSHVQVLEGIRATIEAGFRHTKIDTVVIRGVNDDELADLLEFGTTVAAEVWFIEYMDVGGATGWHPNLVVSRDEMVRMLSARYGEIKAFERRDSALASRYALRDGRTFGIVSSTTRPFCASCDRSRVTADRIWYRCLYAQRGTDLRSPMRGGAGDEELRQILAAAWRARRDQGAVDRLALRRERSAVRVTLLRRDPHLEMHTRGG